jgi:lipid II:glycine glycyltransferase (peptidoglycan interpeptide bridge formation enzyme)
MHAEPLSVDHLRLKGSLPMQITHITADRREDWNAFVAREPSFALLQSWKWGELKERLGWKVFRIAVQENGQIVAGAQMLVRPMPLIPLVSIAYIPRGPLGCWLDETIKPQLLSELQRIAKYHRAVFLKIEPSLPNSPAVTQALEQYNFQPSFYANHSRATIILDLRQDLDDVLKQMRRKTRQYIRLASQRGVVAREGNAEDLPAFYDLMKITGERASFSPRAYSHYKLEWETFKETNEAILFMAYHDDRLLAGRMIFRFGIHAAEFYAGSLDEYTDLHPNYLLAWEAIKWAKAQGCDSYDLWGIPEAVGQAVYDGGVLPTSDRRDGLWGVYQFKRGFGKRVVFYAKTCDSVYSPFLYWLLHKAWPLLKRKVLRTLLRSNTG